MSSVAPGRNVSPKVNQAIHPDWSPSAIGIASAASASPTAGNGKPCNPPTHAGRPQR